MITIWPVDAKNGSPQYAGRGLRQTTVGVPLGGATAARPLGVRSGVRPGTPATTVSISGATVSVRPHAGVIDAQPAVEASGYEYASDTTVPVTTQFAQDQSNPRIDNVWVQVTDPSEGNGSAPAVTFGYTAGTAAGSPSAPSLPDRTFLLARLNVPKAGTGSSSVSWVAPIVVAAGAVLPVRSVVELKAAAGFPGAYADLTANADDSSYPIGLYRHNGTAWAQFATDSGSMSLPVPTAGYSGGLYRFKNGLVHLQDQMVRNTGSVTIGDRIATFPAGMRPSRQVVGSPTGAPGSDLKVAIGTDGSVTVIRASGSSGYIILDDVYWFADQ